jgi:hypothetical protein
VVFDDPPDEPIVNGCVTVHENVSEADKRGSSAIAEAIAGSTFASLLRASPTIPSCRSTADRVKSSES